MKLNIGELSQEAWRTADVGRRRWCVMAGYQR